MTKKKRGHPDIDEVLSRPWCYYCERDFDDLKILINHQKAKHFKCERCGRRLNTAGGLSVHMSQVHKENLTAVDNALPNRAGLDIEIFGMEGVPDDVAAQHTQRVLTNFHQAEAERRAQTGNTAPGVAGGNAAKKPKFESPSDLKQRLAQHKAKMAAGEQNGGSGSGTPVGADHQPAQTQENYPNAAQQYQQPSFVAPPPPNTSFTQPAPYSQSPIPQPQLPFAPPAPNGYPHASNPPFQQHKPQHYPPAPSFSPQPFQNGPPHQQPYYNPHQPQPYNPQHPSQGFHPTMNNGPPSFQAYQGPRPFGAGSPVQPFQQNQHPPRNHTPPQRGNGASLPPAPGLPDRPAFAPQVNASQFQAYHKGGQVPPPPNGTIPMQHPAQTGPLNGLPSSNPPHTQPVVPPGPSQESPATLDELISSAKQQAETLVAASALTEQKQSEAVPVPVEDKAAKKEKDKPRSTRLVADTTISQEEKMAALERYRYNR